APSRLRRGFFRDGRRGLEGRGLVPDSFRPARQGRARARGLRNAARGPQASALRGFRYRLLFPGPEGGVIADGSVFFIAASTGSLPAGGWKPWCVRMCQSRPATASDCSGLARAAVAPVWIANAKWLRSRRAEVRTTGSAIVAA